MFRSSEHIVIHQASGPINHKQCCSRCGEVLLKYAEALQKGRSLTSWYEEGSGVAVYSGGGKCATGQEPNCVKTGHAIDKGLLRTPEEVAWDDATE